MASIWMGLMEVEWDDDKAASNLRKHGVSFAEAATVFQDLQGIYEVDIRHSEFESRFLLLGLSSKRRILTVVHVERDHLQLRIISAREATDRERRRYEQGALGRG